MNVRFRKTSPLRAKVPTDTRSDAWQSWLLIRSLSQRAGPKACCISACASKRCVPPPMMTSICPGETPSASNSSTKAANMGLRGVGRVRSSTTMAMRCFPFTSSASGGVPTGAASAARTKSGTERSSFSALSSAYFFTCQPSGTVKQTSRRP